METKKISEKKQTEVAVQGMEPPISAKQSKDSSLKAVCSDKDCPIHGHLKVRGQIFKGKVIRKFHKRIVIEFERMIYIRKYERYAKSKTKIHARLPVCMEKQVHVGDLVKVQECRPLSKIIHFVFIEKIKDKGEGK